MTNRFIVVGLTVMAFSSSVKAGDLNPPAGPVAPTMKTLIEVEPRIAINATNTPGSVSASFNISQSGSYYLMGNITGEIGKDGIRIFAGDVALDLNGFELQGVAGSVDGIQLLIGANRVTIRNGSITGWGGHGILATGFLGVSIDSVCVSSAGIHGIRTGAYASITNCLSELNTGSGFITNAPSYVSACTARNNIGDGINTGGRIADCVSKSNSGWGFNLSTGTRITGCLAAVNNLGGYKLLFNTYITGCTADLHTFGPSLFTDRSDNHIEANMFTRGTYGIQITGTGNLIIRNSASGNSVSNYSVVANNTFAPVVTSALIASSTNPHANYAY